MKVCICLSFAVLISTLLFLSAAAEEAVEGQKSTKTRRGGKYGILLPIMIGYLMGSHRSLGSTPASLETALKTPSSSITTPAKNPDENGPKIPPETVPALPNTSKDASVQEHVADTDTPRIRETRDVQPRMFGSSNMLLSLMIGYLLGIRNQGQGRAAAPAAAESRRNSRRRKRPGFKMSSGNSYPVDPETSPVLPGSQPNAEELNDPENVTPLHDTPTDGKVAVRDMPKAGPIEEPELSHESEKQARILPPGEREIEGSEHPGHANSVADELFSDQDPQPSADSQSAIQDVDVARGKMTRKIETRRSRYGSFDCCGKGWGRNRYYGGYGGWGSSDYYGGYRKGSGSGRFLTGLLLGYLAGRQSVATPGFLPFFRRSLSGHTENDSPAEADRQDILLSKGAVQETQTQGSLRKGFAKIQQRQPTAADRVGEIWKLKQQ